MAAFLEPTIIVLVFVLTTLAFDEVVDRPALTLCLLVFALTFPGRNRFRDNLVAAAVDIATSWVTLLVILALCGYATRSLKLLRGGVLFTWAGLTPVLQGMVAVAIGARVVRWRAAHPDARRTAIVVGGGALGVKVARALGDIDESGVEFVGYFDDRTDGRLHEEAALHRLGGLPGRGAIHHRERRARGLHHAAAGLAAASSSNCSSSCGDDGVDLLRAGRVRHKHHQGRLQDMNGIPVGRHLRDALHRDQ